jgi:ABC-type oligopeptide transport system ATPase subunit
MSADASPILSVRDLCVYFESRGFFVARRPDPVRAVDDVSFSIGEGESFGLVGESGSGKTTLGRTIVGLTDAKSGVVEFQGRDLGRVRRSEARRLRRGMQFVFQDVAGSLNPRMRIGSIIAEPLAVQRVGTRRERRVRAAELLVRVGLGAADARRYPHELSGGQRQRVGIARALAIKPRLLILDEPVSALDVSIQAQILQLLEGIRREDGLTYLFIAHNLAVVRHFCDRVAVMQGGKIVEMDAVDVVFRNPQHPYTVKLLSSVPNPDRYREHAPTGEFASMTAG